MKQVRTKEVLAGQNMHKNVLHAEKTAGRC